MKLVKPGKSPRGSQALRIAMIADLGADCDPIQGCGDRTIDALNAAAVAGEIDALFHAGDIGG